MGPYTVLVTGATRGIGRAVVEALAAQPNTFVWLGCRGLEAGAALAESLGKHVVAVQLDVTDGNSVDAAAATVKAKGKLDALVNNAGVLLEREGTPLADVVEDTMRVNFDGVVRVTDAFLPLIEDGGHV
eukprot:CAMPEP_0119290978 /NCGR_PEP_ID=MMETSP1329-20130426/41667_1 /TAXON_ID=114041 /ORGANISM="Genus nov. species nov., Strain RCC1024" /LENGTH=128 /DNA_ID=CAMNT_0007291799 /DNA_START=116 /DNA_END=499 /DNA_ORIENTATION=+